MSAYEHAQDVILGMGLKCPWWSEGKARYGNIVRYHKLSIIGAYNWGARDAADFILSIELKYSHPQWSMHIVDKRSILVSKAC